MIWEQCMVSLPPSATLRVLVGFACSSEWAWCPSEGLTDVEISALITSLFQVIQGLLIWPRVLCEIYKISLLYFTFKMKWQSQILHYLWLLWARLPHYYLVVNIIVGFGRLWEFMCNRPLGMTQPEVPSEFGLLYLLLGLKIHKRNKQKKVLCPPLPHTLFVLVPQL